MKKVGILNIGKSSLKVDEAGKSEPYPVELVIELLKDLIKIRNHLIVENWKKTRDYFPKLNKLQPGELKNSPLLK